MARTYRDIAIEDMLGTVHEAMSQVVDWWGDQPPPMKEAIEQFRIQLGAAIDSVEFVKRVSTDKYTRLTEGKGRARCLLRCMSLMLMLWTAPPPARECHGCGRC